MATISLHAPSGASAAKKLGNGLSAFFASVGKAFVVYAERRSRIQELTRLQEMSDEELAEIGIKREEIAQHVFRDLFYL